MFVKASRNDIVVEGLPEKIKHDNRFATQFLLVIQLTSVLIYRPCLTRIKFSIYVKIEFSTKILLIHAHIKYTETVTGIFRFFLNK